MCTPRAARRPAAIATKTVRAPFELQGHRGARGLFPENTLSGFLGALAVGVSSLELDIALTRDGVAVVVHDPMLQPDLTRDAAGAWLHGAKLAVGNLTLAELRRFDVGRARPGGAVARAFPEQRSDDGARIPTLAEVFAATAPARIDAELKTEPRAPDAEAMAAEVVAVARQAGALDRLAVRSFDWRGLRHVRARCPNLPLAWLTDAGTSATPDLWWQRAPAGTTPLTVAAEARRGGGGAATWAPDHTGLLADEVAQAQALGLRVVPWTVNRSEDMVRLIAWGVDGLCTDRPDLARAVMAEAGLALPPPR